MAEKLGRVLCVDDEPSILRSLQWLLSKEFEVKTAGSGQAALEVLRDNDIDVIISDQRMPGMMGSEFLREARRISPRSMRILLTGYSDLQSILRSVNDGEVFRFVNKPWNIKELPKVIADAATIAKRPDAAAPHAEGEGELETGDDCILLIDDDPSMGQFVSDVVGSEVQVAHATSLAEAVATVGDRKVGIILADTRVANFDTTTMLKVLKKEHPDIVSIVYTASSDAVDVISLINQGQIFRFIPKPVKMVTLRQALLAAALKRRQLRDSPDAASRHTVESVDERSREEMYKTVQRSAGVSMAAGGASLLSRIGHSFMRMFGRA